MEIRKLAGALAATAGFAGLLAAAPAMASPVNLITNGDFENVTTFNPDGGSGSVQFVGDKSHTRPSNGGVDAPLADWSSGIPGSGLYDRGVILFKTGYDANTPESGTYAIQLEQLGHYIFQHVATVAGHHYHLSYWLSAYGMRTENGILGFDGQMRVVFDNLDGATASGHTSWTDSVVVNGPTWHEQIYDFTASTDGMNLAFVSLANGAGGDGYPQLDNISLVEVTRQEAPEPGSLALAGLAFVGMLTVGRRRKA